MPGRQIYKNGFSPRCPHCGCGDCDVMSQPEPDSPLASGVALCGNCRRVFKFSGPPGDEAENDAGECDEPPYRIVRERLRCPACKSVEFRTDTTRQQGASVLRYHVCRKCSNRFSSLER